MEITATSFSAQSEAKVVPAGQVAVRYPSGQALSFLFLVLLVIFAYSAPRWSDWNQNSRLNVVRAIVDHGTLQIDAYYNNTGDYAFYKGHYYSDKPPGPALAGVLPYAVLKLALSNPVSDWIIKQLSTSSSFSRAFTEGSKAGLADSLPQDKLIGALARIWLSIWLVSIPVALMACSFWRFVCEITGRYWMSLVLTLALVLGTTLFPYSSLYYNHALVAALLFFSFNLLYHLRDKPIIKSKLMLTGFLLGFSLISQYESAFIILALGIYALATSPRTDWWKRIFWLGLGVLPNLVLFVTHNWLAFGTIMPIGYQYATLWLNPDTQSFMTVSLPRLEVLWGLTFSPYRGLFLLSPFLLLAFPGFYYGLKKPGFRLETLVCLWSGFCLLLFYCCYTSVSIGWWGGDTFGPRYLVPGLPFLVLGVALFLNQTRHWKRLEESLVFGIPLAISFVIVLPGSLAGRQWPAEKFSSPLTDYIWPQLLSGNLARNPGTALGLKGLLSFLPLLAVIGLIYLMIYRWSFPSLALSALNRRVTKIFVNQTGRNRVAEETPPIAQNQNHLETASEISQVEQAEVLTEPVAKEIRSNDKPRRVGETFLVTVTIALVLILSTLPYLFGYLHKSGDKVFMGIMFDVPDNAQYWAWMRAMRSSWVIANPLTPEPNEAIFFNLLWGVLAQVENLTGWGHELTYMGFRLAAIIFWGLVVWQFCQFVCARALARNTAFLLIMLGSGWGWVAIAMKQVTGKEPRPETVYLAEPNTFLSALALPHLIFSAGLIVSIFLTAFKATESRQLRWAVVAAVLALALGLEHAYDLLIVYAVLGGYWLVSSWQLRRIDWDWFKISLIVGLISSPPALYAAYLTNVTPTWKGVLAQYSNAGVFTPDPIGLLILIGPLLLVAIVGLWAATPLPLQAGDTLQATKFNKRLTLVKVWFVAGLILIYTPTNFQIKMLDGWEVPIFSLAVAAIFGPLTSWLQTGFNRLRKNGKPLEKQKLIVVLCVVVLFISLPTTLYYLSWRFLDLNRLNSPFFLQKDEVAAINWLEKTDPTTSVVLSSEEIGYYVGPNSGHRPFLAHWAMTLDYYTKRKLVAEVLNPQTGNERRSAILKEYQVKFVLYGVAEKQIAPELTDPALKKVFSTPGADVYEVLTQP